MTGTNPKPLPETPISNPEPPLVVAIGDVPADLMEAIMADVQARVAVEVSLKVIRAQAITWSDGSLGCPEPGMMYTQALIDGYWVVIDAGGRHMDYRAGSNGGFKYCPSGGMLPVAPVDR